MADKGDFHFLITADDKATAVLDQFKQNSTKSVESLKSVFDQGVDKMSELAGSFGDSIKSVWGVISNPTPLSIFTAGISAAGAAWAVYEAYQRQAIDGLKEWNAGAAKFNSFGLTIDQKQRETDAIGKSDQEKLKLAFHGQLMSQPQAGLSAEDMQNRKDYQNELEKGNPGEFKRAFLNRQLDELKAKEAEIRTQQAELQRVKMEEFSGAVDRSSSKSAELAFVKMMNDLEKSDKKDKLDAARKARQDEKAKALDAERDFVKMMNDLEVGDRRDRLAGARKFRKDAEIKGAAYGKSLLELDTPQQKADRTILELQLQKFFGLISPDQFRRGEMKARGELSGQPDVSGGLRFPSPAAGNAPTISRFLTRGAGDSFDPAMQVAKEQLGKLDDMYKLHLAMREMFDRIVARRTVMPQIKVFQQPI